jgi:hypothetical protein
MKFIPSLLCAVVAIIVCLADTTVGDSIHKQDEESVLTTNAGKKSFCKMKRL